MKLRAAQKEDREAVCFDSVEMGGQRPRKMFAFVFCDFGSTRGHELVIIINTLELNF